MIKAIGRRARHLKLQGELVAIELVVEFEKADAPAANTAGFIDLVEIGMRALIDLVRVRRGQHGERRDPTDHDVLRLRRQGQPTARPTGRAAQRRREIGSRARFIPAF